MTFAHAKISRMRAVRLQDWGWNQEWEDVSPATSDASEIGRVVREDRRRLRVMTERGARLAAHSGKGFARGDAALAVGDWVRLSRDADPETLARVLDRFPRASEISRLARDAPQIIAANVERAWLLADASRAPNLASLERHLIAIEESGVEPSVLLSKIDLNPDWQSMRESLSRRFSDVSIQGVSAVDGTGLGHLVDSASAGVTHCLMGESGTGKSTLINRLAGREIARTGEVRASDRKGRHVTTHRELFRLSSGALFLDTPGMRELVPVLVSGAIPKRFARIVEFAAECRFTDCQHTNEPDCRVREAVEQGELPRSLFENYRRLIVEAS